MRTAVLLAVFSVPAIAHADPDDVGRFDVQLDEYSLGDTAFVPGSLPAPVEIRGVIHSPSALDEGPFPLVIVMHGRHGTCYDPDEPGTDPFQSASQEWPCASFHEPIPSYRGYDYWAAQLASHGYVVVSIGANGINAADGEADDGGASARGELITAHLAGCGRTRSVLPDTLLRARARARARARSCPCPFTGAERAPC